MFSKFFIERPVLANVIAVVTMLLGGVALWTLPVEQYPAITPPTVRVSTNYPGANAQTVANTVASPIEQQVNGVEGMLFMSSSSSSDGSYSLTVTFEVGTNLDEAQVLVQNRVAIAESQLPEEVKRQGVSVKKRATNLILVMSLISPDKTYDTLFLSNYATLRLVDELGRVPGVGDVNVFGNGAYSMRIWLDPVRLKARNLTAQDVIESLREQNVQVAAGQIGQSPAPKEQAFQYAVTALGRLTDVQEFEEIIVKTAPDGKLIYLKDIARIELGSQSYDQFTQKQGVANANIGIYQLPGANAIQVASNAKTAMERLSKRFPKGMTFDVALDTSRFIDASITEVYKTLLEAGFLVLVVILVFLQDWRAVLIPATTVPVTILGAFAAMAAMGFSINILTLFGLVLAIGIVVDDAIVIVENAVHHVEQGLPPKQATIKAMDEVLGPIMGITLVLMAVFIPSAMLSGITGQLYQQFALTIAATALISAINAVTLKPAQCALWLRPVRGRKNIFFRAFEAMYGRAERIYLTLAGFCVRHPWPIMVLFTASVLGTGYWYAKLPTGFLPQEDQGYVYISVQLPDAAAQQRTRDVMNRIDKVLAEMPAVEDWFTIGSMSLIDGSSAPNTGTVFVIFKPWHDRHGPEESLDGILKDLRKKLGTIQDAIVFPYSPPAIRGLGVRGGFEMQVEDRGGAGRAELQSAAQAIVDDANMQSTLADIKSTFRPGVPQLFVDIDRDKVKALDIPLNSVFTTLQACLGSIYVNDFNKFGRIYQVRVQADERFRQSAEDISRLEVRNRRGEMVPISTVATVRRSFGQQIISRYNLYPSAAVSGAAAPGYSSGQALQMMEEIARTNLPDSMDFEWTGMAFQEHRAGNEAVWVFSMAVILVYLVLAAQYESWILPAAVILVVPLGLLGAVAAVAARGYDNNIYTQIGVVLIIALASKNAILIIEFARDLRKKGRSITEAALEAAKLRFRPIVMTSFAFILGVVPLVLASGAGAAGQRALGTAVFGGMLAATLVGVFFVPVFYVVFQNLAEYLSPPQPPEEEAVTE